MQVNPAEVEDTINGQFKNNNLQAIYVSHYKQSVCDASIDKNAPDYSIKPEDLSTTNLFSVSN